MENKKKKLMLLAAFSAAAIFTACGGDSSASANSDFDPLRGKTVASCDVVAAMGTFESHSCTAMAADDARAESFIKRCVPKMEGSIFVYTAGNGCAEAELSCVVENTVWYFYGDGMDAYTCEHMVKENQMLLENL
ncbi:MAG: hypothetical protein J6U20_01400 [Fibrobacter sp.]|jgi:hypothetical protein|nr:hypothetical protein [Fibrobacter sp.]